MSKTAGPQAVILHRLEAEVDELWSFVGKKTNRQWVWITLDATTRQVIAFPVGDRSRQSAEQLWQCIPAGYRKQAVFYTDLYEVHKGAIPSAQQLVLDLHGRVFIPFLDSCRIGERGTNS